MDEGTSKPPLSGWLGWLLAAMAVIVFATYGHYGTTWDEGAQTYYGELALEYFTSGFEDTSCNRFLDLRFYGPLPEMIPALLYSPDTRFDVRHLFFGLLALGILPALAIYGRLFRHPWVPPFAAVAVLMLPRFYGHIFNNSKDVPFAVATAWFMVAATALAARGGGWRTILCGLALGAAAWVRPGGYPLLMAYLVGAVALAVFLGLGEERKGVMKKARRWLAIPGVAAVGWLVMVLPWPWAHEDPIGHPLEAMQRSAAFTVEYPVLFEGEVISSKELPRTYLGKYLLITTPLTLLVLAALGAALAIVALVRRQERRQAFGGGVTLLWLGLPLVAFLVQRPNVYDGLRHFLFVLPAVAVLAGVGAAGILEQTRRRRLAWPLMVVALLIPVKDLVALHPYQMTYFNSLVGGLKGAYGRYETDYWVSSYREAMLWVNRQAAEDPGRQLRVLVAGGEGVYVRPAAEYYAVSNVEVVTPREVAQKQIPRSEIDFYLATTRYRHDARLDGEVVHAIGRQGAVFTVIKRLKAPAAAQVSPGG
ncbi:MAG: hypothetical protein AAF560_09340 [Acidobacteriota bacterium]